MSKLSEFYARQRDDAHGELSIQRLGIHENMEPRVVTHREGAYPYIFMFFHNHALINCGMDAEEEAGASAILWSGESIARYGNPDGRWDHSWVIVSGQAIHRSLSRHKVPVNSLLRIDGEDIFMHYMGLLLEELRARAFQDSYILASIFDLWIYELSRLANDTGRRIPDNIISAENFIQNNYNRTLSLKNIAEVANLSVPRFSVIFKKIYGETPVNYLVRLRLQRAEQLLHYNDLSIKQIAMETGFRDQLYFSRMFKRLYTVSPKSYRQKFI